MTIRSRVRQALSHVLGVSHPRSRARPAPQAEAPAHWGIEPLEDRVLLSASPYVPDDAGRIVIGVEHYDEVAAGVDHDWVVIADASLPDGQAMQANPNTDDRYEIDAIADSPSLSYEVYLPEAGTYYVWVRAKASTVADDSVHIGLDGTPADTADKIEWSLGDWTWTKATRDGAPATLSVAEAGQHTLNMWMREDGAMIDQIMLTTDSAATPSGVLAESERRADSSIAGTVWADLNGDGVRDADEPGMAGVRVYLDDNDNGALDWADVDNDDLWDEGEGERWVVSSEDDAATIEVNETGQYLFEGLPAGSYIVRQVVPIGFEQITPATASQFVEQVKLTASDAEASDYFGCAVAIDGGTAVIGAQGDDDDGELSGSAYVFEWDNGWVERAKLASSDREAADLFGSSVAIDGDLILIGAPSNGDNGPVPGSAYIFRREGMGWTEQVRLAASDGEASNFFGSSVAIDGNTAIVGAWGDDERGYSAGAAYIFQWNGVAWIEHAKLLASDGEMGDQFGISVAISGDTAIVGAWGDANSEVASGSAYVFRRDGSGWTEQAKLSAGGASTYDRFGISVAIDGDIAIVGAVGAGEQGVRSGAAYLFQWDGTQWIERAKVIPPDVDFGDSFGNSVAVSNSMIAIGSASNDAVEYRSGSAYVYLWGDAGLVDKAKLIASDAAAEEHFGNSVSIDNTTVLIGTPDDDGGGYKAGSAYIFTELSGGAHRVTIDAIETQTDLDFGNAPLSVPTPEMPDLNAASDTGLSNNDNLTNHNNADASSVLSFTVGNTVAGVIVRIFASNGGDPVLIGESVASGATTVVTTDGLTTLADGEWTITATQHYPTYPAGESPASAGLTITIDTAAPLITINPLFTDDDTPAITGTVDDPGATVSVHINGQDYAATVSPDGSWVLANNVVSPLTPGLYNVVATATDAAGNIGTDTTADELEIIAPSSSISGTAWADLNGDGVHDVDEPGMPGVVVYLDDNNNAALEWTDADGDGAWDVGEGERWRLSAEDVATTTSVDEAGQYLFDELVSGDYVVRQVVPVGMEQTQPSVNAAPVEVAKLLASDAAGGDNFGSSVSIDGDHAMIGAYGNDDGGTSSGSAYMFHWNGSGWVEQAKLTASDAAATDYFGYAVAIDGDYAVVGAFGDDDGGSSSGSAYIFHWNGSAWIEQAKLTASDAAASDLFGQSVSINGNNAIIGADRDDDGGADSGSAYIFHWNGSAWIEQAKLTASDAASYDNFGVSVAINGDNAIVGAYRDDGGGADSGSAYIFHWNGSAWAEQAKLTASDAAAGDYYARTGVSIDGNYAIVGTQLDDDRGYDSGSVYLIHWNGSAWAEKAKLTASDAASYDYFGIRGAIDGSNAIVGAYGNDDSGSYSGSAYIFSKLIAGSHDVALTVAQDATGFNFGDARVILGPDLNVSSDSGVANDDDLTKRNNDSPGNALTFNVAGTQAGDAVQIYADNGSTGPVLIGSATATGDTTTITTDGTTTLADGIYSITAVITDQYGTWLPSEPLSITIDTAAPLATVDPLVTTDTTPRLTGTINEAAGYVQVSFNLTNYYQAFTNADGTWYLPDNALPELGYGDHSFYVLTSDDAGNYQYDYIAGALTIAPMPRLSVSDAGVAEGDEGTTQITFTVSTDNPFIDTARVDWRLIPGTATPNLDYNASINGSLIWFEGQSQSYEVAIDIYGDRFIESDETFQIELYRDPSYSAGTWELADAVGVGTILNDDVETFSSVIAGTVWSDLDADGVFDAGETGLPGVTVYLDDNDNGALDWTDGNGDNAWNSGEGERWILSANDDPATTGIDETGSYAFDGLASGDYVVRQVITQDFDQTYPIVNSTLIEETFPSLGAPNSALWSTTGYVNVSTYSYTEPSAPYVLRMTGSSGEAVLASKTLDLSTASGATLSFYETPSYADSNERLVVEYLDANGNWNTLWQRTGTGVWPVNFTARTVALPAAALHDQAAVRFRYVGADSDGWYLDSITLQASGDGAQRLTLGVGDSRTGADFGDWLLPPFEVVSSSVADGAKVNASPATIDLTLSVAIGAHTVDAADVLVDGVAALGVAATGESTIRITLPTLADGQHTVELLTGSLLDYKGRPVAGHTLQFTLDTVAPRVIASSFSEGDVINVGQPLVWQVTFDEPIDQTRSKIRATLRNNTAANPKYFYQLIDATSYNPVTGVAVFEYDGALPEGAYQFSLSSYSYFDAAGNRLDGEAVWPLPAEGSGDGTQGGDFIVNFHIDRQTPEAVTRFNRVQPLGSLVAQSPVIVGVIHDPGDTDTFTVNLQAGQSIAAILKPTTSSSSVPPTATTSLHDGSTLTPSAGPGEAVIVNLPVVSADTTLSFTVSSDAASSYTLQFALNAIIEPDDAGQATPLPLELSRLDVPTGAERWAVRGEMDFDDLDNLDAEISVTAASYGSRSLQSFTPLGQVFRPVSSMLEAVQFMLSSSSAEVYVNLRQGGITGAIVATSDLVSVTEQGWATFVLNASGLDTSLDYTFELVATAGSSNVLVGFTSDVYPDGYAVTSGAASTSDYLFRVGSLKSRVYDAYSFDLMSFAGKKIDIALAGNLGATAAVQLIGPDGTTVLATSSAQPLGADSSTFDQAILGFTVPEAGVYTLQIIGDQEGAYTLAVNAGSVLDVETNNSTGDPLRPLGHGGQAIGYLASAAQGVFGLASSFNQAADQIFEIDPATGEVARVVVQTSGTTFGSLAYDGSQLYALILVTNPAGSAAIPTIQVYDPQSGALLDSFALTGSDITGLQANAMAVYGDELVLGRTSNGDLLWFDKATGIQTRTTIGSYPSEYPSDIAAAEDRGSVFVLQYTRVFEVDAVTGALLNTLELDDGIIRADGLAWFEGALFVSSPYSSYPGTAGGNRGFYKVNPDTGALLQSLSTTTGYTDLAGAGIATPQTLPIIGQAFSEGGDVWEVTLAAGDTITLQTATPFDGAGALPGNDLNAAIVLYDATGTVVAVDAASVGDGRNAALTYTAAAGGTYRVQLLSEDGRGEYVLGVEITQPQPTTIAGRYIFYNRSYFDGNSAGANSSDDAAIAPDKQALLPGQTATFTNYTSYSRGINGVMIDIANLASPSGLTTADFEFRVGNSNDPATWSTAPSPQSVTVRPGEGAGGGDRVTLIWADNAIQKQWLQVRVLANANTGLAADDVFYFGNAIGETGDSVSHAQVNTIDAGGVRDNPRNFLNPAPLTDVYDINRDRRVDAIDYGLVRDNRTNFLNDLNLINTPEQAPTAAPDMAILASTPSASDTLATPTLSVSSEPTSLSAGSTPAVLPDTSAAAAATSVFSAEFRRALWAWEQQHRASTSRLPSWNLPRLGSPSADVLEWGDADDSDEFEGRSGTLLKG